MKKDYEKPIVEVIVFDEEVKTGLPAEASFDASGWWDV